MHYVIRRTRVTQDFAFLSVNLDIVKVRAKEVFVMLPNELDRGYLWNTAPSGYVSCLLTIITHNLLAALKGLTLSLLRRFLLYFIVVFLF